MNRRALPDPRGAALPVGALVVLELALRTLDLRSDSLALPSEVAQSLASGLADGDIVKATLQTLWCAVSGAVLAAFAGIVLGSLLGLSRWLTELAHVPVESLRHIPPVALMPIVILVLGLGAPMEIVVVAFTCFWPMLLLTRAAVAGVEPRLLEVARVLQLGRWRTVRRVVLPAASPRVLVAFRLTLGIALIVSITTEIAANPLGLGYLMVKAQQELQPARLYAGLAWLAALGWSLNAGLLYLERRMLHRPHGSAA